MEYHSIPCHTTNNTNKQQLHVVNSDNLCIHENVTLQGKVYNLQTHTRNTLPCPIYHVSSDGNYAISPSLWKITSTQRGYGVDWTGLHYQTHLHNITNEDGIYLTHIPTQQCTRLYTLTHLVHQIGLPIYHRDIQYYGFHTKLSYDGKYILFVLRS